MAFMVWSDSYAVGIPIVDNQHRRLFELVNHLHDLVSNGSSQSEVGEILASLISYTVEHFATEERLFAEQGYPDVGKHKAEHDDLTRQVLELQGKFEAREITISFDVLDFLSDWLKRHTTDSDLDFARWSLSR